MGISLARIREIEEENKKAFRTLCSLAAKGDCKAVEAALQKRGKPFPAEDAYELCIQAVRGCGTVEMFQLLYRHAVPLEYFTDRSSGKNQIVGLGGLVQEAAIWDRAEVLEHMLDLGLGIGVSGTVAETALRNGSVNAMKVLCRRKDVEFSVTERMLSVWGLLGKDPRVDACCKIAALRLLGEEAAAEQQIPILPGMHVLHAAKWQNWPLVRFLCRKGAVTVPQGKEVLAEYMCSKERLNVPECALLLDALFDACPALLRCAEPRYLLTVCTLCEEVMEGELLRPWLEQMPGRQVTLCGRRLGEMQYDFAGCLSRWEQRMGPRFRPVLQRKDRLPMIGAVMPEEDAIRIFFERCEVRGKAPAGKVSRLAMDVLQMASPALLAELLEAGKLFPGEDWPAMLEYCRLALPRQEQEKRAVLLAYYKKEVNYEL